jgi:hypothetical protein
VPATFSLVNNLGTVNWDNANAWVLVGPPGAGNTPGAGDTAILGNGVNTKVELKTAAGVAKDVKVASLRMDAGYAGEVLTGGKELRVTTSASIASGTFDGGKLVVDDSANAAALSFYGGLIKQAEVTVGSAAGAGSTFFWAGGTAERDIITLMASATTTIAASPNAPPGAIPVLKLGKIDNFGKVIQSRTLNLIDDAVLLGPVINSTNSWEIRDGASIRDDPQQANVLLTSVFNNSGTFKNTTANTSKIYLPFNNNAGGTVQVSAAQGQLIFKSNGTHEGSFNVVAGAFIEFERYVFLNQADTVNTFKANSVFAGAGTLGIARGNKVVVEASPTAWTFGTLWIDETGSAPNQPSELNLARMATVNTLIWQGGKLWGTPGGAGWLNVAPGGSADLTSNNDRDLQDIVLKIRGTATWEDGDITMRKNASILVDAGGLFKLDASDTIKKQFVLDPLNPANPPRIIAVNNGEIKVGLGAAPTVNVTVRNAGGKVNLKPVAPAGPIALNGGLEQEGGLTELGNTTLASLEMSGGTITATNSAVTLGDAHVTGGTFSQSGGSLNASSFQQNGGAFSLSGSSGTITGAAHIDGGTFSLAIAQTFSVPNGLFVGANGTLELSGGGTLAGSLGNAGLVRMGSASYPQAGDEFSIAGDFTQSSSGTLHVDLAFADQDLLRVLGTAHLGGELEAALLGGTVPTGPVELIDADDRDGAFATLDLAGDLAAWQGRYDDPLFGDGFSLFPQL